VVHTVCVAQFMSGLTLLCVCGVCVLLQQLSMSSIVPCEESDTQLCFANSVEVRSDEICADSVVSSADDAVSGSEVVKRSASLQSRAGRPVSIRREDAISISGIHRQSRSRTRAHYSSQQKSSSASAACDVVRSHRKSQQTASRQSVSDAEADAGNSLPIINNDAIDSHNAAVSHPDANDNSNVFPMIQNNVKLSSQVCLHDCLLCLNISPTSCSTVIIFC